jgi:peptide/nickel transport system permease protein
MLKYVIRRTLLSFVTILFIATLIFLIIHLIPGDPAYIILGDRATPESVAALRNSMGLDRPLLVQYLNWLNGIVHFDFGRSLYSNMPIGPEVAVRLFRTLELILLAIGTAALLGIPLGIFAAAGRKSTDFTVSTLSIIGLSSPSIVVGPIIAFLFGVKLNLLPTSGFVPITENVLRHVSYVIMPTLSLAFFSLGIITRMSRSSVIDNMRMDYARTAKAKGLSGSQILFRHVLKNAMIPIITLIGLRVGLMLGGTVITESLFNWPGLSTYLIDAAYHRDYPVIQAIVMAVAAIFVFINLSVDLLAGLFDPRIKYE